MRTPSFPFALALAAAVPAFWPAAALAHDYPTLDRVRYVQECMAEHPGPTFEMTAKCVCVVDALAQQVTLEELNNMSTAMKAATIGGERGGYIRESEGLQAEIRRWRGLQKKVKEGCFIQSGPR
jgi:hypothetical protein